MTSGNPNDAPSTPEMDTVLSKLADGIEDADKKYAIYDNKKEKQLKEIAAQIEAKKQEIAEIQEKMPKDISVQVKTFRDSTTVLFQAAEKFHSKADSDGKFAVDDVLAGPLVEIIKAGNQFRSIDQQKMRLSDVLAGPLCEYLKTGDQFSNIDPQKMRLSDVLSPSLIEILEAQKVAVDAKRDVDNPLEEKKRLEKLRDEVTILEQEYSKVKATRADISLKRKALETVDHMKTLPSGN